MYYVIIMIYYSHYVIRDREKGRECSSPLIFHSAPRAFSHFNLKYGALSYHWLSLISNMWFGVPGWQTALHILHHISVEFQQHATTISCKGLFFFFSFSTFESTLSPKRVLWNGAAVSWDCRAHSLLLICSRMQNVWWWLGIFFPL